MTPHAFRLMKPWLMASKMYPSAMAKYHQAKKGFTRIAENWLQDVLVEFGGNFQIFADSIQDICQHLGLSVALRPTTWQRNAESFRGVL